MPPNNYIPSSKIISGFWTGLYNLIKLFLLNIVLL
jgi:hypothetical protein